MKKELTLLTLEEIKKLTEIKKLKKKDVEILLLSVCMEKHKGYDIEDENDKIDSLDLESYEKTLYGKELLNLKFKYLIDNYKFDENILSNVFRFCVMWSNLENAKYLLENNKFKIMENSKLILKSQCPILYKIYLETQS